MEYTFIMYEDVKACRKSIVVVDAEDQQKALEKLIEGKEEPVLFEGFLMDGIEGIPGGDIDIYDQTEKNLLYHGKE